MNPFRRKQRERGSSLLSRLMILMIRGYQKILSPLLPPSCRFYPSCSQYAILAIRKHGAFRGGFKATIRILKCNPFFPGGYDPI